MYIKMKLYHICKVLEKLKMLEKCLNLTLEMVLEPGKWQVLEGEHLIPFKYLVLAQDKSSELSVYAFVFAYVQISSFQYACAHRSVVILAGCVSNGFV